ncbi:MAG: MBL fold metallo-hydrolase [Steroidobacteraceae bacterium]
MSSNPMTRRIVTALCIATWASVAVPAQVDTAGTPAPTEELVALLVAPGIYVVTGAGGNVAVWTGPDGIVLVDGGLEAQAERTLEAVARIAPGAVRFVVNTHWHPDHTGVNERASRAGAVIIAHEATREVMSTTQESEEYSVRIPASPRAALPTLTLPGDAALHLNGDLLRIAHVAAAHSGGDLVLWWRDANVVHLGDVYYNGGYPFVDLAHGGSIAGVVATIEGVLSRADDATVVIPGHGPVARRADLVAYRDMLVASGRRVRELVEQGRSLDEVLAARPTEAHDDRYGKGPVSAERFVRILYADLAARR